MHIVEYDEFLYLYNGNTLIENLGPGYLTVNGPVFYNN